MSASISAADSAYRAPGPWRLFAGLSLSPLAWSLAVLILYGLASYACFPTDAPRAAPLWPHLRGAVGIAGALCWALALFGCWLAYANWRACRSERAGTHRTLLQTGDGHTRFLAMCGVLMSIGFCVALLFTTIPILGVRACAF